MNKKANTVLFMVIGFVINIIIMIVLGVIGLLLLPLIIGKEPNETASTLGALLLFLWVIGGGFIIYTFVVKKLSSKYNLEDKIISPKPKQNKK